MPTEEVVGLGDPEEDLKNAEKAVQSVFEKAMGRFEEAGLNRDRVTTKIVTGAASRGPRPSSMRPRTAAMAPSLWVEEDSRV